MKKIIFKIVSFFITILVLSTCNDNNDPDLLFEDVPSERVAQQIQEVKDLLLSSPEGWKVSYFTDSSELGGFSYVFKFLDEQNVEMDSDFGATKGTITQSEWDVLSGSTVKLSFTTRNKIHELSDSDSSPDADLLGQGYKGSFEFLYYGTDGEDIIFRANKEFNEVRFIKATSSDFEDLKDHDNIIPNIATTTGKSVFRTLSFDDKLYDFSYNETRRFATNISPEGTLDFGVGFTPNGIVIEPAIETSAGQVSSFTYDSDEDNFKAFINDEQVAIIEYSEIPSVPFTGYEFLGDFTILHEPFLNSLGGWEPDLTNDAFKDFISDLNSSIAFLDVTRIDLYDLNSNAAANFSGTLFIQTSIGNTFFNFTRSIENNKVFLTFTDTTTPAFAVEALQPLLDIFFDPKGLYVDQPTTLDDFSNRVFTFVPASNTTLQFSSVGI